MGAWQVVRGGVVAVVVLILSAQSYMRWPEDQKESHHSGMFCEWEPCPILNAPLCGICIRTEQLCSLECKIDA